MSERNDNQPMLQVAKILYTRSGHGIICLGLLLVLLDACSSKQPPSASYTLNAGAPSPQQVLPPAATCPAPQLACQGVCTDTRTDPRNCGSCGWGCGLGTCSAGICVCPSDMLACAGGCTDTSDDPLNCGACGRTCSSAERCQLGQCTPLVAACNPACAPGQQCVNGVCQCPAGQTLCAGACIDPLTTPAHCGTCGNACAAAQLCQAGMCVCGAGQTACATGCVDPQTSVTDCGGCGKACAPMETCMAGLCRPPVGMDGCSGVARDVSVSEVSAYQAIKIPLTKGVMPIATEQRLAAVVQNHKTLFRVGVSVGTGFTPRELSARVVVKNGAMTDQFFAKQMVSKTSADAETSSTFQIPIPPEKIQADTTYSVELVECGAAASGGMMQQPRFPATGEAPLDAIKTGVLKVQLIPLSANSRTPDTSAAALKVYQDYLEAMYPIERAELSVGMPLTVAYPVNWNTVIDQLRQLRTRDRPANDIYYYGLLRPTETLREYCRNGCTAGVGYVGSPTQAATRVALGLAYGDEMSAGVMAHEVGHNHGRNHAPCAPGNRISGVDSRYPHMTAITNVWGYDSRKQRFLDPQKTKDIMSYCDPKWISDYTYKALVTRVAAINMNMFEIAAEQPVMQQFRVLLSDADGPRWSQPFAQPDEPFGEPETAEALDIDGEPIEPVTVYRTVTEDTDGATILVPTPKRGWNAIRTRDGISLPFSTPISVPAPN